MSNGIPIPDKTTQPVAIILATHSTDENFNGDCDYAVVQLTPELVDQVHRRVELARQAGQQDDDLYELNFWGGTAEFYDSDLLEACQEAIAADQTAKDWLSGLEQNGHALLPPTADLAACQSQQVECDRMVVRRCPSRYEIAWTASPRHTNVDVTTRDLPLTALEGYIGNG
jgi:hypothetical protein